MDILKNLGLYMLQNKPEKKNDTLIDTIISDIDVYDYNYIMKIAVMLFSSCGCGSYLTYLKNNMSKNLPNDNKNYDKDISEIRNGICEIKQSILLLKNNEEEAVPEEPDYDIDDDIKYKYGDGCIMYRIGNLYYHGISLENIKLNKNNIYDKCFFEYFPNKKMQKDGIGKWNTYDSNEFCNNCELDDELSNRKKIKKVYRCMGHEITK